MKTKFILLFFCLFNLILNAQKSFYGELGLTKTYFYFDTIMLDTSMQKYDVSKKTKYMASGIIFNDSVLYYNPALSIGSGVLKLNDVPLSFSEMLMNYEDTVERKINNSQVWKYESTDAARSFTFSQSTAMPDISSRHIIPALVQLSNGLSIVFGQTSHTDSVQVIIYDYNAPENFPYSKTVAANSNSINIPASDISQFINKHPNITVSFIKDEFQTINNKSYRFNKRFNIVRPVAVVE